MSAKPWGMKHKYLRKGNIKYLTKKIKNGHFKIFMLPQKWQEINMLWP